MLNQLYKNYTWFSVIDMSVIYYIINIKPLYPPALGDIFLCINFYILCIDKGLSILQIPLDSSVKVVYLFE